MPQGDAFGACLGLLRTPDPRRGIVARRCAPDPPVLDSIVVSEVRTGRGPARELRSRVVELDPPRRVATASEGEGACVLTALEVEPAAQGGSTVTLRSEVTSGLAAGGTAAGLLDALLFGRAQRRSARATLRRVRELAARRPDGGAGLPDRP